MTKATLLIVEDDGILAAHLENTINRLGYTVLGPVATGEEALTLFQRHQVSLVFMDIELAGDLNGIQTAEIISRSADVPIVFLTSFSQESLLEQAKTVAPFGYLIKPVGERELAATITMSLHRHALERALKESRSALEKSETKYHLLFEHSPLGIFQATLDGEILTANAEMERIIRSASSKEAFKDFIDRVKESGAVNNFEYPGRVADGKTNWISMNAKLTSVDEGNRQQGNTIIDGFATDITDRKHAEEQLQALNNELELRVEQRTRELQETQNQYLHVEKLTAIGRLSASIAHEFNNPLQGILSVLNGLKKRAILEALDRELLDGAIEESNRIRDLISSLQDFNRPSSGKKTLMDLNKSLESVLLLAKSNLKGKRISVECNYAEQLPRIQAVSDQIKQVLLNLLNNAADACLQRGGVITVSTWQEDDDRVAVAIKDTGVGIHPSELEMIFQPFYTTKLEIKGTGLGLSVCHGIINNHHGEIRVESQPGEGATFTVFLPIFATDAVA